jgi:hypothetical protein
MVRSACPLALLLPTVMKCCLIPRAWHYLAKLPLNSLPLSDLIHKGFPHLATSRHRKSAVLQACLDCIGSASTHLLKGSTATTRYWFPSASLGNGPARSMDQPLNGPSGGGIRRFPSTKGDWGLSFWQIGHFSSYPLTCLAIPGHQYHYLKLPSSFSLPTCPSDSWVSLIMSYLLGTGGTFTQWGFPR